ncbi:MAG: hypothetical protein QXL24_05575 [Candidatus Jordarchaeaceae archaeon]
MYQKAKEIFVADIDEAKIELIKKKYPRVSVVPVGEIHKKRVSIFSPCALGNCINFRNINELNCEIILGGANNQLEDNKLAEILHKMGILYAPDYVVNAGGLISVYEEYKNNNSMLRQVYRKVKNLQRIFAKILLESKIKDRPPLEISNRKAERIFNKK